MQVELNFIPPTLVRPTLDLTRSIGDNLRNLERRAVDIEGLDVDTDPALSLARRGFAAVPFDGKFDVGGDDPHWRDEFGRAAARAIGRLVNARHVLVMPSPGVVRKGASGGTETPLFPCHGDFTPLSAADKLRALQQTFPAASQVRRFAAYNAWWLVSGPPQDVPLAFCDANTVVASDMLPGKALVHDATGEARDFGEIAFYRYNKRHRWFWYPNLTSSHLLVFAGHDSSPDVASQVPHCAFRNPSCPPGTPTRVSVECRCFVVW